MTITVGKSYIFNYDPKYLPEDKYGVADGDLVTVVEEVAALGLIFYKAKAESGVELFVFDHELLPLYEDAIGFLCK